MKEYRVAWKSRVTKKEGAGRWQTDKGYCEAAVTLAKGSGMSKEIEHWIEEREAQ